VDQHEFFESFEAEESDEAEEYSEEHTDECSSSLLFEDSQLTLSASSILVMQYKTKHNLTNDALEDLLQLLRLHCPTPNICYRSLYLFKKQFLEMKLPFVLHYYCTLCSWTLTPNTMCCPNLACARDLTEAGAISSFIELAIETQLQKILQRRSYVHESMT
jgi:hypothetical protein